MQDETLFDFIPPTRVWTTQVDVDVQTAAPTEMPTPQQTARYIDHTMLKPQAQRQDILKLCQQAIEHEFYSVCVNTTYTTLAAKLLLEHPSHVCVVVGFPLGASTPAAKAYEAAQAIEQGATEIDMVLNVGALKDGDYALVARDIELVVRASYPYPVKVILETCLLNDEEKMMACALAKSAGAAFVKTSTGFNSGGATVHDIELMRRVVGDDVGVKASGGIRDYETAIGMLKAGANRLGCSSSVAIVQGKQGQEGY